MARVSSWLLRPLALRSLLAQARLAMRLLREPRVPALVKAIPALGALYLVWPLDFVPDLLPGLGQLDDLGVVVFAIELFTRLCPAAVHAFHKEAIVQRRAYSPMPSTEDVIEAEWKRG